MPVLMYTGDEGRQKLATIMTDVETLVSGDQGQGAHGGRAHGELGQGGRADQEDADRRGDRICQGAYDRFLKK